MDKQGKLNIVKTVLENYPSEFANFNVLRDRIAFELDLVDYHSINNWLKYIERKGWIALNKGTDKKLVQITIWKAPTTTAEPQHMAEEGLPIKAEVTPKEESKS